MKRPSEGFLTGVASLGISLLVNGGLLAAFDAAVTHGPLQAAAVRMPQAQSDDIKVEFIEAPVKTHARKPEPTKKIAARDALNQDAAPKTAESSGGPKLPGGLTDQLEQVRAEAPQTPRPPSVATPAVKPAAEEKTSESDKKAAAEGQGEPKPQEEILAAPGLTGADRITTQAMARSPSKGAALYGLTSFEATGSGMGVYMKNLKERVWLAWFPYISFQYPGGFKTADAVVSFTLNKKGEVKIVRLVDSEGSPVFAAFCMRAIQEAAPFGPLPDEILALIGKDELELKFGFHYR